MAITYFGNTTFVSTNAAGDNAIIGILVAAPVSGNITTARGYIQNSGPTDPMSMKVLVYADSGSHPAALVCASDSLTGITIASGMALRTFTFSTPGAVVSGTSYWLCFFGSGGGNGYTFRRDTTGTQAFRAGPAYPTVPNPFGTDSGLTSRKLYLEAGIDDTPAAAAFVPQIVIT